MAVRSNPAAVQHGSQVVVVVVEVVVDVPQPATTVSYSQSPSPSKPGGAHSHGSQWFSTTSHSEPFQTCLHQLQSGTGVVVVGAHVEVVVGSSVVVVKQLKHGNCVVVVPFGSGVVVATSPTQLVNVLCAQSEQVDAGGTHPHVL